MSRFTFYGGTRTIGGTKILIEGTQSRLLLDFGAAFEPAKDPYYGLRTVPQRSWKSAFALGLLPPIPGLYPAQALPHLPPGPPPLVLISHLHLDHTSLLPYLDPEVPVAMSAESLQLLRLLESIGEGLGEHRYLEVAPGEPLRWGEFEIVAHSVDHDLPGAVAYEIRIGQARLLYSGDLRGHGLHPERHEALIERVPSPTVLFLEGTRLGQEGGGLREEQLPRALEAQLLQAQGAVINLYPRNLERLAALLTTSRQLGRTPVLSSSTARLFRGWYETLSRELGVRVYGEEIRAEEIRANPEGYLLELPYPELETLVELELPPGSIYLHADGPPLGPYDPAWGNLERWLERLGLSLVFLRSSGHAEASYLSSLIQRLNPELLVPMHSTAPERKINNKKNKTKKQ